MDRPVTRHAPAFRPDIEGLRGVAVLVVVLFHAGIAGVGGGFVGVDVFFVLSGFLITGLLLREREQAGRIRLSAFYARRVRRLVPAAVVVLVATLAASWQLLDPLTRIDALLDGAASAASVGNVRFALAAGDYFAPAGDPSPFLQFWSLGVEEQFYLAWPLLLIVALRGHWPRVAAGAVIGTVLVGSLAVNLVVTDLAPAWAFYSLPTRAWQLAIGGMLALAASSLGRIAGPPVAVLGWLGLGAVGASAVLLGEDVPYPGSAALVPSLGAAAIILAGNRPGGPALLLSRWPIRFLGRISYSLYLWHWPLLVLGPIAIGGVGGDALPFEARLGLVGAAVLLATATCLLVEEPFRFGLPGRTRAERGESRPRPALATGLTALVAIAVTAGGLSFIGARDLDRPRGPAPAVAELELSYATPAQLQANAAVVASTAAPLQEPTPTSTPTSTPTRPPAAAAPPSSEPAPASAPSAAPTRAAMPVPTVEPGTIVIATPTPTPPPTATPSTGTPPTATPPTVTTPSVTPPPGVAAGPSLPAGIEPPLARAATDMERLKGDRCIAYERATDAPNCVYGGAGATFTVALVGDSHGSHWFPAIEAIAVANGWRVVPFIKVSCPFIDLPVYSNFFKREYRECAAFRESTIARLAALQPNLTLVAQNKWVLPVDDANKKVSIIGASLGRTILRVPGRVALIVDTPHAGVDVPTCLAAHPSDIGACATPRARAMSGVGAIEAAAAQVAGVPTIDLRGNVCVANPCPAVVDARIVYRDTHHLTATFARSLAPALGAALGNVIGG